LINCPIRFFNDPTLINDTVLQVSYNSCSSCNSLCFTCFAASNSSCSSCYNITVNGTSVSYHKHPTTPTCVVSCPKGYFGNNINNICERCQTGCISCNLSSSDCQSCEVSAGVSYYYYNNKCLTVCPDGTFKNDNLSICEICNFFTLNGNCIANCPDGYTA